MFLSGGPKALRQAMRGLWAEHVKLTRQVIVQVAAGENHQRAETALMKNQEDIGKAFVPYFGEAVGWKVATLLKEHIAIAGRILGALKAGQEETVNEQTRVWYRNADDIAGAFAKLDKSWDYDMVQQELYKHLALTTREATAQIKGDVPASVNWYFKALHQILTIADTLSLGLSQQLAAHGAHIGQLLY